MTTEESWELERRVRARARARDKGRAFTVEMNRYLQEQHLSSLGPAEQRRILRKGKRS